MDVVVSSVRLDHLGLPAVMAQQIGFVDELDALAGTDPRETISFGQTVLAMTLNALGFTSKPLYLSPEFFKCRDLKFLLGESKTRPGSVPTPEQLNEHKLGRALDKLAEIGPDRVFLKVAMRAFREQGVQVPVVHLDTTTHSFHGRYEDEDGNPLGADFAALDPEATDGTVEVFLAEGYSKDYRLHCKQVVQELLVSGDGDVPLLFRAHSGNASDVVVMRERIDNLKRCLSEAGADDLMPKLVVADCKLYSQATMEHAAREGTHWITRVPDTVGEVGRCIESALRARGMWKTSEADNRISYQAFDIEKWGIAQSFIVVRTESSKARIAKAMPKRLSKEVDALEKRLRALRKRSFACLPDLEAALEAEFKAIRFVVFRGFTHEETVLRSGPGRPRLSDPTAPASFKLVEADYVEDKEAVRREELESACFVLATNAPVQELSTEEILKAYLKDQQGVERGFRFLKDPQYFCDAFFLKNPKRVVALLCVMTMALLLHSLLQRSLRMKISATEEMVPDQKGKPTKAPTLRWVNQKFEGLDVVKVREPHKTWFKYESLDTFVETVLRILGPPYQERYTPAWLT